MSASAVGPNNYSTISTLPACNSYKIFGIIEIYFVTVNKYLAMIRIYFAIVKRYFAIIEMYFAISKRQMQVVTFLSFSGWPK